MKGVTAYQLEILQHVAAADPSTPLDFDELLDKLSWEPSKESAQFVIRAAITKGFLVKGDLELRRGRKRVTYLLTAGGRSVLDPRAVAAPTPSAPLPETAPVGATLAEPVVYDPPETKSALTEIETVEDLDWGGVEEFLEG